MKIRSCMISKITLPLHRQFIKLHFRDGIMLDAYMSMKDNGIGEVIYAIENDTVLGWSILKKYSQTYHAMIYVKRSERNKGIAKKIIKKLNDIGIQSSKNIRFGWSEDSDIIQHLIKQFKYIRMD